MGNLFDGIIKEDSVSPVENVVIKYLNYQNQRNIPQELSEFTTKLTSDDPQAKTELLMGLINPAGGLSKVKSFLKGSEKRGADFMFPPSAGWISNSGREYKLGNRESHLAFIYKLERMFGSKTGTSGKEKDLFDRGWIRIAYPGVYEVPKINNKLIELIRKNVINEKKPIDKIYIDARNVGPLEADAEQFIKFGKKVLFKFNPATGLYDLPYRGR